MKRYTIKKDGKYFSGQGLERGFLAHGIAACYSFSLEEARELQKTIGGEVVEVVHVSGWKYVEAPVQ